MLNTYNRTSFIALMLCTCYGMRIPNTSAILIDIHIFGTTMKTWHHLCLWISNEIEMWVPKNVINDNRKWWIYCWRKPEGPEKTIDMSQVTDKLYHIMSYIVHHAFELTILVVVGTDCMGSCKSTIRSRSRRYLHIFVKHYENIFYGSGFQSDRNMRPKHFNTWQSRVTNITFSIWAAFKMGTIICCN